MTIQIPEVLILGRKKHSMASFPLEDYREVGGAQAAPKPRGAKVLE
jgi:hypothetical protein